MSATAAEAPLPGLPIRRGEVRLVAALLAIFALLAVTSMLRKNPTFDETAHLAAGISYVQTGDFRMNAEHPVLPKLLAGAAASLSGVRADTTSVSWTRKEQWDFARETLYGEGRDWRTILLLGRLPMVLLGAALGFLVWRWTRDLAGPESAAVALALYAFCPNVLAHTRLVTTDVPLTLCVVGTAWSLWRAWRTGAAGPVVAAAAFTAASMVTKFSAFSYGPVWLALALLPSARRSPARAAGHAALYLGLSFVLTEVAVLACYGFAWDWTTMRELGLAGRGVTVETMSPLRRIPLELMASIPWPSPDFARGMKDILLFTEAGHPVYLLGKTSDSGWWWSPLVTLLVKMPLPLILLAGAAKLECFGNAKARRGDLLFLLLPALLVLATNVAANLGLGVRHLLPMFPFVMMFGTWPLRFGWPRKPARAAGLALLVAWQVGGAAFAYPHFLPYFNEAARLAGGGERILGDSNLDWGQDLSAAAARLRERGVSQAILGYFGTANPFVEGIEWQLLPPTQRAKSADPWVVLPETGEQWLVLSTTNRQGIYYRAPGGGKPYPWLDGVEPAETVGHGTISLYEISTREEVQRGLADVYLRHGLGREAEVALRRALGRVAFDSDSRRKLVQIYVSRGELERADSTIVNGPSPDVPMLLEWLSIRKRMGDAGKVREGFEQALRGFSQSAELKNAYAWWLQETGVDLDQALQLANDAVRWDGKDPYYLDTRGMVHLRMGRAKEALADFETALAVAGGDLPAIRWHRALALDLAGRSAEAAAVAEELAAHGDLDEELRDDVETWLWENAR